MDVERRAFAPVPRAPSDAPEDANLTVGVLGGMGPLATAETFRRLVLATPAARDQDHLHVVVDSDPTIPDRTEALLHGGASPLPKMLASARRLQDAGAQVLCLPCNTAHAYLPELVRDLHVPVVDMLAETALVARAHGGLHGLLATSGTARTGVYATHFVEQRLPLALPDDAGQRLVDEAIARVKAGADFDFCFQPCRLAVERLLASGVTRVVLGCTELSLLAPLIVREAPITDALQVMVDKVVKTALRTPEPRPPTDGGGLVVRAAGA